MDVSHLYPVAVAGLFPDCELAWPLTSYVSAR